MCALPSFQRATPFSGELDQNIETRRVAVKHFSTLSFGQSRLGGLRPEGTTQRATRRPTTPGFYAPGRTEILRERRSALSSLSRGLRRPRRSTRRARGAAAPDRDARRTAPAASVDLGARLDHDPVPLAPRAGAAAVPPRSSTARGPRRDQQLARLVARRRAIVDHAHVGRAPAAAGGRAATRPRPPPPRPRRGSRPTIRRAQARASRPWARPCAFSLSISAGARSVSSR